MSSIKRVVRSKRRLPAEIVGLSLTLAGAACAESTAAQASAVAPEARQVANASLTDEEVCDVTMASFYVADKENPGGERLVANGGAGNPTFLVRYAKAASGRCGTCRKCKGNCTYCRWHCFNCRES